MTYYPTGPGGYNCAGCGAFVPSGATHYCYARPGSGAVSTDHGFRYAAALERIAKALEDIAAALASETTKGKA